MMYNSGLPISEISNQLKMNKSTVNSYLPYIKVEYNKSTPSKNAMKLRKWREKE